MPRHDKITGDGSVIETKRIFPSIHNRIITLEVGLHEVSCLAISEYDSFFRRILVTSTVFVTEYNFKQHVASDIGIDELYVPASSLKSQDNLNTIADWTDQNLMKLNEEKTSYMVFSRSDTEFATRLSPNGRTIGRIEETKLVGVWLTTWLD